MPYTADGTVPDLIFNCHSVPTRFMIGQLLEASFQRICVEALDYFDATVFNEVSVEFINEMMEKFKIEDKGYTDMYNADTGERIKTKIFLAPTFYYRLQKFSSTAKYCVNNGTLDLLTRQPLASRKSAGGMRQGEMEVATFYSSGLSSVFNEKLYTHSDHHEVKLCANCGTRCDFNSSQQYQTYSCSICQDKTDIKNFDGSWASLVFISTLEAMGINA